MTKLAMFARLTKADAAQRLVYGSFDETPDRAREVFDYNTSKPLIEAWSQDRFAKSNGKSFGNVRGQHNGKIAAGKLVGITFNDDLKKVDFVAHIIDDNEWEKVEQGVYTGFSPGGSYAKRWKDGTLNRYTADFAEVSIVDVPCNPSAYFTMTKSDGAEAQIEFVLDKAYEPGNEATKDRAEDMAKSADGTTYKDHVIQARADLIAENAVTALANIPQADPDLIASLNAAMAKADLALAPAPTTGNALQVYAAATAGKMLKCDNDLLIAPPSPAAVALIGADLVKSIEAVASIRAACEPLAKGLDTVANVASALSGFGCIARCVSWEESVEGDTDSVLPQMAADLLNGLKGFLIAMVQEEVAELITSVQTTLGDVVTINMGDGDDMELARQIVDLVKADDDRMTKAGMRNSKPDTARIQSIHDKACELGADCVSEKSLGLGTENDRLTKAIDAALPRLEKMTAELNTMTATIEADKAVIAEQALRIIELGKMPALTKAELAHAKENDGAVKGADDLSAMPNGMEKANAILRRVGDVSFS